MYHCVIDPFSMINNAVRLQDPVYLSLTSEPVNRELFFKLFFTTTNPPDKASIHVIAIKKIKIQSYIYLQIFVFHLTQIRPTSLAGKLTTLHPTVH